MHPALGLAFGPQQRHHVAEAHDLADVVEPVDPLQGGVLDLVDPLPWVAPADQLGLVQPDDGLGQGGVVGIAAGADCERLAVWTGFVLP
jgi:hypothetical protein